MDNVSLLHVTLYYALSALYKKYLQLSSFDIVSFPVYCKVLRLVEKTLTFFGYVLHRVVNLQQSFGSKSVHIIFIFATLGSCIFSSIVMNFYHVTVSW